MDVSSLSTSLEVDKIAPGGTVASRPIPVAVAFLMVHAARTDGTYDRTERDSIRRTLEDQLMLTDLETKRLLAHAEDLYAQSRETADSIALIRAAIPVEARPILLEMIWRVVIADRKVEPAEQRMVRTICDLLSISDEDSRMALARAAGAKPV